MLSPTKRLFSSPTNAVDEAVDLLGLTSQSTVYGKRAHAHALHPHRRTNRHTNEPLPLQILGVATEFS